MGRLPGRQASCFRAVLACAWLLTLGACAHADFVSTDTRYQGRPRTQPWVFVDRLPPYPYISIGIIEVIAPAGTSLSEIFELARQKGSDVGCDVVVDRGIHRITSANPACRSGACAAGHRADAVRPAGATNDGLRARVRPRPPRVHLRRRLRPAAVTAVGSPTRAAGGSRTAGGPAAPQTTFTSPDPQSIADARQRELDGATDVDVDVRRRDAPVAVGSQVIRS